MKAAEVEWVNPSADFRDGLTEILRGADGRFFLHLTTFQNGVVGSVIVAFCESADRLGRWALDRGAKEVRHSYDLTSAAGMR